VLAATEIITELKNELAAGNLPETRVGIGIHYGEAVTGNIGSSLRKQYSITGSVVIIASRIEQLNKKHLSQLLISQEVYDKLKDDAKKDFAFAENALLKGSNNQITIYKFRESENDIYPEFKNEAL
jgi:adenylate cyclase